MGMKKSSSSESRPEGKVLERGVKGACVEDDVVEAGGGGCAVMFRFVGGLSGILDFRSGGLLEDRKFRLL